MSGYRAYSEYKTISSKWIDNIPTHWEVISFKRVVIGIKDGTHGTYARVNEGFPLLSAKNVLNKGVEISHSESMVSEKDYQEITKNQFPQKGDLLITCVGTIGRTCIYEFDKIYAFQRSVVFLRLSQQAVPKFYKYYVESKAYQSQLEAQSKASAQSGIYMGDLINTLTVFPPYLEQQKIANFLDYETAKIDTLIEKQQQLIKLLKEKRQAVISHAATKGLNPNAPMKDSGVEWLGEVPEGWGVSKLKHIIAYLESGVSVNAADIPAQNGEFGVLKTSCVYTRSFRVEENKTVVRDEYDRVKCPIREGSIIISRMNTPELVGASALIETKDDNIFLPDRLWQTVFKDENSQNPKFIAFFMMIKGFRNQISLAAEGASSSMQNIAKGDYLSINITFPNIQEQNEIVYFLKQRIDSLNLLEAQADKAISLIQERRTALISAAVTGKIDVRNWQASQENTKAKG